MKSRQLQAAQLPKRSRVVPLSALGLSIVALLAVGLANQLWPQAVAGPSVIVWLLALLPLFVLSYYKGWGLSAIVLAIAMTLFVAIEVAMAGGLRGEGPDWRALGFVMMALIAISFALGAVAQWQIRHRATTTNLAFSDPDTGLPNRRVLDFFLNRHFAAASRGRELAVVLFDLDDFKKYRSRHGRRASDAALRIVASILDGHTRSMDLSGRFDGQQFLAIFPSGSPADAFQFAVRVRKAVETSSEFRKGGLTVSAGVAGYAWGMAEERHLIDAATQALHAAKSAGRNRVMVRANDIDDEPQTSGEGTERFAREVTIAMPGPAEDTPDEPYRV